MIRFLEIVSDFPGRYCGWVRNPAPVGNYLVSMNHWDNNGIMVEVLRIYQLAYNMYTHMYIYVYIQCGAP